MSLARQGESLSRLRFDAGLPLRDSEAFLMREAASGNGARMCDRRRNIMERPASSPT